MSHLIRNVSPHGLTSAVALLALSALHACSRPSHFRSVPPPPLSAGVYYLDCSASQSGKGTEALPWNSPVSVNAFTFLPGDRLLLHRGTACKGALTPQGSGTANAPILIDAYGTGPQPVIRGGDAEEALKLFNQQYWEINNLEITGGNRYGIYVTGNAPNSSINHIYLRNLNLHDATYTSTRRADSGEVFISTNAAGQVLNDVLIDGVTAHDSHRAGPSDLVTGEHERGSARQLQCQTCGQVLASDTSNTVRTEKTLACPTHIAPLVVSIRLDPPDAAG